ncbi:MAG: hypothetical protein H6Q36_727 [Chloroflexi bacterium]|nr:hypothetical protein [Chloroflexota bacterium]
MLSEQAPHRLAIVLGLALILVGAGLLLGWTVEIDIGWPAWIIGPGLVIFVLAFVVRGSAGAGLAVAGSVVTAVGVILAIQEVTDTWASWAYAWALVAPGAVGAGLLLYGLWTRDHEMARGGFGAMVAGLVIFGLGFAFFEGVIGLNDLSGPVADLIVPACLVGLGALLILVALRPRGAGAARPGHGGPSSGAAFTAGSAGMAGARTSGAGPAGRQGAVAGGPGARFETLDLPLDAGVAEATVEVSFGAGRLEVGQAVAGRLVDGEYGGGVIVQQKGAGHVRLSPPNRWDLRFDRAPFDWDVGLATEIPVRLALEIGAADVIADLGALRVPELRIRSGAAQVRVLLPRAGLTRVDAEGGAASLSFAIAPGVAARIRSNMALGSVAVDEARFPRQAPGLWASAGADTATDRVELELRGGLGSVSVG